MRINQFVARASGLSRRAADQAIQAGRVTLNRQPAGLGEAIQADDTVTLDGHILTAPPQTQTIMLNKPPGYVCSRQGQGSRTIYDLLPPALHHLKPVGRLDKYSSGLLLLTNDGDLANQLTHPRYAKTKIYEVRLHQPLVPADQKIITGHGLTLEDGLSRLQLTPRNASGTEWCVTMQEGRNRQIRRTFAALNYRVTRLHRTHFGPYSLGYLSAGAHQTVSTSSLYKE